MQLTLGPGELIIRVTLESQSHKVWLNITHINKAHSHLTLFILQIGIENIL